ncbi:hypothetical protein CSV79_11735 [Sporosarcina sp. P13]|uniref:hypothetical protein n=1 Tax=Sporosarcina sp. P13 TaxID=2048263 RepID=UPI000C16E0AF|nr:hypothetical protein [Sporosarcina sp. P13]PIC63459.1 hypothetical protein CSV79_11735 [Sporosarcina sp. P13]
MFLMDNVIIILFTAVIFFFLFTFVNIYSFCNHGLTGILLTAKFLYLFFIMPFKGTADIYNDRKKIIRSIKKDKQISSSDKLHLEIIIKSRWKTFRVLYKAGAFSYGELMLRYARWYLNKPFQYDVKINTPDKKVSAYEQQYISSLELNLREAVH